MTDTISGTAVATIESAKVTEGGEFMFLTYTKHDGTTENLAVPMEQVPGLLTLSMQCLGRAQENESGGIRRAIPAKSWEMHVDKEQRLIFTVRLPGGAHLAFMLPLDNRQQVVSMSELLARRAAEPDDKTRH